MTSGGSDTCLSVYMLQGDRFYIFMHFRQTLLQMSYISKAEFSYILYAMELLHSCPPCTAFPSQLVPFFPLDNHPLCSFLKCIIT